MSTTQSLLVELLVEELPPKALKRLGDAFAASLLDGLKSRGLAGERAAVTGYATPRRLAAHVSAVHAVAADQEVTRKVMPVSVALDASGKPSAALRKALAKLGREHLADRWPDARDGSDHLYEDADGKARALFLRSLAKGATLVVGLQGALDDTITQLPIPKMSYQLADGWTNVQFVRPVHGLVALHGANVVPVHALGLESGRDTLGHRFEASVEPIRVQHADHYVQQLEQQGAVIAAFVHRRAEVSRQLQHAAGLIGLKPVDDAALLDEVTGLVERPNVLLCEFESQFLAVPPECLILTMKANQKYFPLLDAAGALTHKFLVVSNIRPDDASAVIRGNERVVRPRLADAKFFFDQDRKRTLESRVPGLAKVVYHAKLGTMRERVERVRQIARWAAQRIGADVEHADRAALLAKADLLTDMVGEFPELQGVMGGYYARHDRENESVAEAIASQYINKRSDKEGASSLVADALLIADRAETLVGVWGIGLKPTGDKDPYALRRHALTIIDAFQVGASPLSPRAHAGLDLRQLLLFAASTFGTILLGPSTVDEVETFVFDRYFHQLADVFDVNEVEAVISQRPPLQEVGKRVRAVREFKQLPEAQPLAAANKRVNNILKKSDAWSAPLDPALFREEAEKSLAQALANVAPDADAAFAAGDYARSLQILAALRAPVDAFFEHVMVNTEDAKLRANRLALLSSLHKAMNRVADLSRLAT